MNQLVDSGNKIIVIEHNMEIVKDAVWITTWSQRWQMRKDCSEGTPEEILKIEYSYTG